MVRRLYDIAIIRIAVKSTVKARISEKVSNISRKLATISISEQILENLCWIRALAGLLSIKIAPTEYRTHGVLARQHEATVQPIIRSSPFSVASTLKTIVATYMAIRVINIKQPPQKKSTLVNKKYPTAAIKINEIQVIKYAKESLYCPACETKKPETKTNNNIATAAHNIKNLLQIFCISHPRFNLNLCYNNFIIISFKCQLIGYVFDNYFIEIKRHTQKF